MAIRNVPPCESACSPPSPAGDVVEVLLPLKEKLGGSQGEPLLVS